MNTKYVPDGKHNVIDRFSYCPSKEEEEEEEEQGQQDDTSAQVTTTSAREVPWNLAGAYEPDHPTTVIEAGTAVDAAKALIHCIKQHHRGKVFDLLLVLGAATVKAFDFERLLCRWRSLKVEAGVGEGPTERALRACMDHLIEEYADFFKETAGDLFTWAFSPGGVSSPDQLVLAKVL
ncbi:hypothetical protein PQX77_010721 [Marasmius sp. AFHP31]|nr:hypothetical protein PQX77_010721 [Marasmius sp. AFHP31]